VTPSYSSVISYPGTTRSAGTRLRRWHAGGRGFSERTGTLEKLTVIAAVTLPMLLVAQTHWLPHIHILH
jgi:hypothetical protein